MPGDDPADTRSRREFLLGAGRIGLGSLGLGSLGLAALAAACTSDSSPGPSSPGTASPTPSAEPGSMAEMQQTAAVHLSMLSGADSEAPFTPGKVLLSFALAAPGASFITNLSPKVYIAKDRYKTALGPFTTSWYPFTGYDKTHDHSPETPLTAGGVYSVELDIPSPGNWGVAAVLTAEGKHGVGESAVPVAAHADNEVGSKAVSVPTPVGTTEAKLKQICTREPACHLHTPSLSEALKNGKPTVVVFSTPLLCQSQFCGPVTDEVILVQQKYGARANVLHVEEFLPGPNLQPPAPTAPNRSPAFKAWHLLSEPWVFVVDRKGVIRSRLGPGPTVAPQIEQQLLKVL